MNQVRVGTGVIVVRKFGHVGKVLVGKRKGSHAEGLYAFPGGHLDFGEEWVDCVYRELREECGDFDVRIIRNPEYRLDWFTTNDIMPQYGKHYITIFLAAQWLSGEPVNAEPHKCEGWEWVTVEELQDLVKDNKAAQWIPINYITNYREELGL